MATSFQVFRSVVPQTSQNPAAPKQNYLIAIPPSHVGQGTSVLKSPPRAALTNYLEDAAKQRVNANVNKLDYRFAFADYLARACIYGANGNYDPSHASIYEANLDLVSNFAAGCISEPLLVSSLQTVVRTTPSFQLLGLRTLLARLNQPEQENKLYQKITASL